MKKKFLFIGGTHGDEKIGVDILAAIQKDRTVRRLDWIVGNGKAVQKNKRYIDVDLNRAAPGNSKAKEYEKRRAWEILKLAKKYKYVIDIHGTKSSSGIFIIVTNPKIENLIFAASLPVRNVVIWVAKKSEIINPLSEYFPCGLEIECGPQNSKKIRKKLRKIITDLLKNNSDIKNTKSRIFQVYGRVEGSWNPQLKDFEETIINGEKFYPLLAGQYQNITCYKMKKIDFLDLLAY